MTQKLKIVIPVLSLVIACLFIVFVYSHIQIEASREQAINNAKKEGESTFGHTINSSPANIEVVNTASFQRSQFGELPNFSLLTDTKTKKAEFFLYLLPIVYQVNKEVLTLRKKIQLLSNMNTLDTENKNFLLTIAKRYKLQKLDLSNDNFFHRLLSRVDIVPASLALAQASNESAWGTSRFAREANNLFGQWCFTKGCGIVPKSRASEKTHEVASFASVKNSVAAYVYNINSSSAYHELRTIRSSEREEKGIVQGEVLAKGLTKYSERGEEYVKEIQAMIRSNNLSQYDKLSSSIVARI